MAAVRLHLLDGFALRDHRPLELTAGGQRLAAFLALNGRSMRSAIAGSLWPERTDAHAHGCLRSTIWRLNRNVKSLVDSRGGALALAPWVWVDVEELVSQATRLFGGCAPDAPLPFVGELLPGWDDDWVMVHRERLRQLRLHALEAAARWQLDAGNHALALENALAAVCADPLRESAHRLVIAVHLAEGNAVEATRHYTAVRTMLRVELDVEPSPLLRRLVTGLMPV